MIGSFTLFGKEIGTYGVAAIIGILATGCFAYIKAMRNRLDEVRMVFMLLFSAIGVFVGGHILYGITNIQYIGLLFQAKNFTQWLNIAGMLFGGQVFYGGLLGGIAAAIIYAKATKLENLGGYADIMAAGVPLFHTFGRIGCFLGGCCYGIESSFGFTFHNSLIESANGVNRFPVQLFEAGFNLILFFVMWALLNKGILKNKLFFLYLAVYSAGRFVLEFFRGDSYRGFLFGLSTSQIIALMIIATVLIYTAVCIAKGRNKKTENQEQTP
ncbi:MULTISPECIES: prolipoprotein diacylglyceryl transferase [unclassified Ruminococcus]|uniref:prolipoprotein diacylglyceryl transferase n=1 Tax=unclassified Ruminococcus TaxID=2608920 RepID=UPI0021088A4E|nr:MULTISPECIES: prolipoprotein diacylglyceryl transferase family protein [unclassified Ruminococcus]MCQ4021408.1 hypothetical protein [Ruminococcus sp. zg-924]MCQ4113853.1 hypothetical protein [Ruminococcus sp. zg-921]